VILDFLGSVDLDSKPDCRYVISGKTYVAKVTNPSLSSAWDVRCNGVPITRTVLVTLLA
jgi:hypothetical protein